MVEKIYKEEVEAIIGKYPRLEYIDSFVWFEKFYMVMIEKKYTKKGGVMLKYISFVNKEELDIKVGRMLKQSSRKGIYAPEFIQLIIDERNAGLSYDQINQKHNITKSVLVKICKKYDLSRIKKPLGE